MKKINLLVAVVVGTSIGVTYPMNNQFISLPSAKTIKRTLQSAGFSEIVDLTDMQFDLEGRTLSKQEIRNKVDAYADEVPVGLGGLCPEVPQADRDKIVKIIFTLNLNKPINNSQLSTETVLPDYESLISLPDSEIIKYKLKSAGFSEIVDLEHMHIVLGSKTLSRKKIVEIVNAYADEVPKGLGGLVNDVSQKDRHEIIKILFGLDCNQRQSKL